MIATEHILFVAWQDPSTKGWFPIARLTARGEAFDFAYTRGFVRAQRVGAEHLLGFPEETKIYHSSQLFPFFENRVMPPSRPDYREYLDRFGIEDSAPPAVVVLERNEGKRTTDAYQVFPQPRAVVDDAGRRRYEVVTFVHGLSHALPQAQERALQLQRGETLFLMDDWQNEHDRSAFAMRTEDKALLGYVPRYFAPDVRALRNAGVEPRASVLRVNLPPAPVQQRILLRLDAPWPDGFLPFAGDEYLPLPTIVHEG